MDKRDCINCDRLQEKVEGNAPARPIYVQPTMYDHMSSYMEYQDNIKREKEIRKHQQDLLKLNANFTDLKLVLENEDKTGHFSTQNLLKFNHDLKSGTFHYEPPCFGPEDIWKNRNILKPVESLTNISRSPIQCPVKKCNQTVGITSILSHFVRDHMQEYVVDCFEIFNQREAMLLFKENILKFNENLCLGVLVYGGDIDNPNSRPALTGVCRPNAFLFEKDQGLINHLPILIMGCKTSLSSIIRDRQLSNQLVDPSDSSKDIVVLWLSTVETTRIMHCTITVFNLEMTTSRSTIVEIRNLRDSQDPQEFLSEDTNYLMLSRAELDLLSSNGEKQIKIEIFIHSFISELE